MSDGVSQLPRVSSIVLWYAAPGITNFGPKLDSPTKAGITFSKLQLTMTTWSGDVTLLSALLNKNRNFTLFK